MKTPLVFALFVAFLADSPLAHPPRGSPPGHPVQMGKTLEVPKLGLPQPGNRLESGPPACMKNAPQG